MSRPELNGPAQLYYNEEMAEKYATNTRLNQIQRQLAERALELLELPDNAVLLLDIGCGSGLSTEVLNESGYLTCGIDVSQAMLVQNETDNLMLLDAGEGIPFQPGSFDGAISISAIQWLCYSNSAEESPFQRLVQFFSGLFGALKTGRRAVFQLYPESQQQLELIQDAARRSGFQGRLQIDFPNSAKAKKFYLVLESRIVGGIGKWCHGHDGIQPSKSLTHDGGAYGPNIKDLRSTAQVHGKHKKLTGKAAVKVQRAIMSGKKAQILKRKARLAAVGQQVRPITKYTGRKRTKTW